MECPQNSGKANSGQANSGKANGGKANGGKASRWKREHCGLWLYSEIPTQSPFLIHLRVGTSEPDSVNIRTPRRAGAQRHHSSISILETIAKSCSAMKLVVMTTE